MEILSKPHFGAVLNCLKMSFDRGSIDLILTYDWKVLHKKGEQ
jgi:hypothetical protein